MSEAKRAEADGAEQDAGEGHDEPRYMLVWGGLALLTLLEVWVAATGLPKSLIVASLLGMAIWKAALVALYYMHLRFEPLRLVMLAVAPLLPAVILVLAVLQEF